MDRFDEFELEFAISKIAPTWVLNHEYRIKNIKIIDEVYTLNSVNRLFFEKLVLGKKLKIDTESVPLRGRKW